MSKILHLLEIIILMILTGAIRIYQIFISPMLYNRCRYNPTCSNYAIAALKEWGILKGSWLAVKRIVSCHPCGGWGEDPIPKRNKSD